MADVLFCCLFLGLLLLSTAPDGNGMEFIPWISVQPSVAYIRLAARFRLPFGPAANFTVWHCGCEKGGQNGWPANN